VRILTLLETHLAEFALIAVGVEHLEKAVRLIKTYALTSADAIHLATALIHARELGIRSMRFATCDAAQAEAARAEGLKVLEPA